VRDTSRKVRAVKDMRARQGRRCGGYASYGYTYDKERNKLIIDEEAAQIVKRVFNLYISGIGYRNIAKILTAENIPTPTVYDGYAPKNINTAPQQWSEATIKGMITNKAYIGHTVSKHTYSISYKQNRRIVNKEEDRLIFYNTHEPIIDGDTFEIAQNTRLSKKRPTKTGEKLMFSGLVFCPDCGRAHNLLRGNKTDPGQFLYNCGSYRKKGRGCTPHSIRIAVLEKIVTEHFNMISNLISEDEKAFAQRLMEKGLNIQKTDIAKNKLELEKAKHRVEELDTLFNRVYEDRTLGALSEERYQRMSAAYEQEQQALFASIQVLEAEVVKNRDAISGIDKFIKIAKKHLHLQELNAITLRELIEKIVVHEKLREHGVDSKGRLRKPARQQVDIYYNFVGVVE
jgi:hypothetical protein